MSLTTADLLEIHDLVARYCLATDNGDVDAFMATWVGPDRFGGFDSGPFGSMTTWEELREFETHHVAEGGMARGKRHQGTNVVIEPVSDDEVHVTHDLIVLEVDDAPRVIATGRYDRSVVVRTEAGWRFQRRTLEVDPGFFVLARQWEQAAAANG